MQDYIIIAIIIVIAIVGFCSTIKHFKGQGGCCGGGDYRPKKKKLPRVKYLKTFQVEGMHCEHCKNRVEEAVNDIHGIAGKVDLKKGLLTVSYAEDIEDSLITTRIQRIGYKIISPK